MALQSISRDCSNAQQASYFDKLNDDCLHHLYKYIKSPLDVAHASEASHRLFAFASVNIYPKYANMSFFKHCYNAQSEQELFELMNCLLKHFGSEVTHCCLNGKHLNSYVYEIRKDWHGSAALTKVVLQKCPKLVQVRMQNFKLLPIDFQALMSENMQAPDLQLINMFGPRVPKPCFWTDWSNLRSLTIHGDCFDFKNSLQKLEKLSLADCNIANFKSYLQKNGTTLKSLSLVKNTPTVYAELVDFAPNLEHLKICVKHEHEIRRLDELKYLKHLQIIFDEFYVSEEEPPMNLDKFKTLEELDLVMCTPDIIQAAAKVTSLKCLSIRRPTYSALVDTVSSVSSLPNLQRLFLSELSEWSTEDTVKLLDINHSLEDIVVQFCGDKKPKVQLLLDCLMQQPARKTVRLSQVYNREINVELDESERKLLQDYRHLLRLRLESSWILRNKDKEDGDDFLPEPGEFFDPYSTDYSDYSYDSNDQEE